MSDNLLLTLLGAVSVGALVMSMNKEEEVRENWWAGIQLSANRITMQRNPDGSTSEVSISNPAQIKSQLDRLHIKASEQLCGKCDNQNAFNETNLDDGYTEESYTPSTPSLGSGMVTGNDYVSYPTYNQTITAPSPSLGLPAQIRYNPPSLNDMGITENFSCNNRPVSNKTIVENYMSMDQSNLNPGAGYAAGNYDKTIKDVVADSNQSALVVSGRGIENEKASTDNVVIFDRYMVVPGKAAGRFNRGNGIVDRIRGDLPVCVDPCQKGWFASPGSPADLTVGALSVIGGGGEQANAVANFKQMYGGQLSNLPSSGGTDPKLNMISQITPTNNTVSVKSFY